MSIKNLQNFDISPKNIKTKLKPQRCEFELHGVNIGVANALRRVILSENKSITLWCDREDYQCNDPFMTYEFVQRRLACVPIDQNTPLKTVTSLDFKNNQDEVQYVYSKELNLKTEDMISLASLQPNRYIKIKKIYIKEGYPYEDAVFGQTCAATCVPLDTEMFDEFANKGTPSGQSNPMKHKITFETIGTIDPIVVIQRSCDEIIQRCRNLKELIENIKNVEGNYYILEIPKENPTIGNLIMKTAADAIDPEHLQAITFQPDMISKKITIKMKTQTPKEIMSQTIKTAVDIFTNLKPRKS